MENNSDHFLSNSLEFQTYEDKVELNDISVEHIAESLITPPRTTEGKSLVECPVCFVKFTQKNNLSRHMQRFHNVKPPRSHLQLKIDPSLSECSECGMKFTRKSNLHRHMKKFHEFLAPSKHPVLPKIFSCTECDRKFTQWKNCLRHMRNLHSVGDSLKEKSEDQPSLECESTSALEDNMEYVIEVDPFPVISPLRAESISLEPTELLESVSPSESHLSESNSNYKRESSVQKSSKVICSECGVWFSTPFNLRRHEKRLHNGKDIFGVVEAIPVVETTVLKETPPANSPDHKLSLRTCRECHVTFSSPFNLRRHMKKVHAVLDSAADSTCKKKSGSCENRLFCPLCTESDISFSTSFNLRRHMKRIHPQNQLETGVAASPVADETTRETCALDSDENRLSCPLCLEGCVSFSTPYNLRRHMQKFHQQEEEDSVTEVEESMIDTAEIVKCPRCDYRANRLNLYVHFNLIHGLQVIIEYQVFDSETQLDEWLSQISPEAQFVVRKSNSNRMVISCSQPNRSDEFCPAEMVILTESGKCTVHYVKTHVHES